MRNHLREHHFCQHKLVDFVHKIAQSDFRLLFAAGRRRATLETSE
jgi:hypothetical protein